MYLCHVQIHTHFYKGLGIHGDPSIMPPWIPGDTCLFYIKNMVKKTGDWKKHVETNSRLMKKFEESRAELEKVLRMAQEGLQEKGDPEELLKRHTVSHSLLSA